MEPLREMNYPKQEVKKSEIKASWRSLFTFTTRQHSGRAIVAIVSAFLSGLIKPTSAVIYGQLFDTMTDYGAGSVDTGEMVHRISKWCIGLTLLAVGTWIVEWVFLWCWIVFGELQAKSARHQIFASMLEKNIEWYDLGEDGIAALLSRIET